MNKIQFGELIKKTTNLLDHSYRAYYHEGDIRWSRGEGWKHFMIKCKVVRLLKEGTIIYDSKLVLADFITERTRLKLKKWQTPKIYTEAKFCKNLITDILAITIDGAYAILIVDKEEEKSLKRKERLYRNMQIETVVIRV